MKLIGITGGVGMGKSTAQSLLEARRLPVIDTDQLARDLVAPGQVALQEIATAFGSGVLRNDGALRRKELAQIVFSDPQARRRLESILHPRIREAWSATVMDWRRDQLDFGAVVIPLLFETDTPSSFDATVCVACSPETQRERLEARGWTCDEIRGRLAAQWPVEKKIAAAEFVIWTDGDLEVHATQWDHVLRRMGA